MLICAECGTENPGDARFCHNCGSGLDAAVTDTADSPAEERADESPLAGAGPLDGSQTMLTEQPVPTFEQPVIPAAQETPRVVPAAETTTAAVPARREVTLSLPRPSPVALWAVGLLGFSAFFPWLSSPFRLSRAIDIPFAFLYDLKASRGGLSIGVILLILAGLALVATMVPRLIGVRRVLAFLVVVLAATLAVQWYRFLSDLDATDQLLSYLGVGVYAAMAAGLMLFSAPARAATKA